MVHTLECYICHKPVERHEYTRHVGSHLAGNNTGALPRPDLPFPAFSYPAYSTPPHPQARTPQEPVHATPIVRDQSIDRGDPVARPSPADRHREARLTPSHSPVRSTTVPDHALQQVAPKRQSTESNAFQIWLEDYAHDFPKYTTIDGQKRDSELQEFRQAARVRRGITRQEIVKIVEEFEGFPSRDDQRTCLDLVQKAPIFPGLVAYIYTHLIVCPNRGWLGWVYNDDWSDRVSELEQSVERWSKYDEMWCILHYDDIKQGLLEILRATKVEPAKHKCNSALLNGTMVLSCDILNLAALAALCVTGSSKQDILDQRGVQVGRLIELFHNLLESNAEPFEESYRRCFFNVLIQLSKDSGCCPDGMHITEGSISGLIPKGGGGFGDVYRGRLDSRLVAVKALKRDNSMSLPAYSKQVSKEAIVWRYLRHPNCLPLYGVYIMPTEGSDTRVALVSPWMENGTLSNYLKRNPEANRTKLILDVVRGLTYLHTMKPHVAHRDIKPDNILITSKGNACLADFGLVSTFDTADHPHTPPSQVDFGGTWNYMAPEMFSAKGREERQQVNKRACDMYALGCTIYAAYTGRPPFGGMACHLVQANVMAGKRPDSHDVIPLDMWSFVENLWDPRPPKRLTAEMALDWMKSKASHEGVDSHVGKEEWEWRRQSDDKSSWSVSL